MKKIALFLMLTVVSVASASDNGGSKDVGGGTSRDALAAPELNVPSATAALLLLAGAALVLRGRKGPRHPSNG